MTIVHRVLYPRPIGSLEEYVGRGGGRGLEAARNLPPARLIAKVTAAGLRGRGGAGFPVGRKWRTVARNIALGLEYRGIGGEERGRRVREAIALAGLEGFEDAFPATLSGGMRQRVALMRTLVVDPGILLMDEPFGALDTHTKINLHAELLALWQARHPTVVFVTHDLSEAITLADRIVVMTRRPGRVKLVHEVKLARPRDVIKLRETDEYGHEYGRLWHVLGEELAAPA